jgi:hypothetical protein
MVTPVREYVRFTVDNVLQGLRYHFRELGIAAVLEEGLQELIERQMGRDPVYVERSDWLGFEGDYQRAAIILEIARVSHDHLREFHQGKRFLSLQRQYEELDAS